MPHTFVLKPTFEANLIIGHNTEHEDLLRNKTTSTPSFFDKEILYSFNELKAIFRHSEVYEVLLHDFPLTRLKS